MPKIRYISSLLTQFRRRRMSLRHWLILKLAGNRSIVINVSMVDGQLRMNGLDGLMVGCRSSGSNQVSRSYGVRIEA